MSGPVTLKQTVYDAIFEDIIEGRYPPGSILTENGLMENYGMGKAPVREALIELCKDQALQSLPRKGYLVKSVTLQEVVDLLDFRVDLEVANFRRAAGRFRPEQIAQLQQLSIETDASGEGPVTPHWLRNEAFHLALCATPCATPCSSSGSTSALRGLHPANQTEATISPSRMPSKAVTSIPPRRCCERMCSPSKTRS